jgi:prenyl protein peptidase
MTTRTEMLQVFQTAYTTLFGAYTSYLFLRTSSKVPPLTAHVFCNTMGFPQLQTEMRRFPTQKLGEFLVTSHLRQVFGFGVH